VGACDQSLQRLKSDWIDLYQIHFDDGRTPVEEVTKAFEDLKSQGKIRSYGIGHVSPERAAAFFEKGIPSTVMGELNAVSRNYYSKMLPLLETTGAGYIGFSITGRGMLTSVGLTRNDLPPGDIRQMDAVFAGERRRSALRVRDELKRVGRELGAGAAETGIAWAISQQDVLTGLVGPSTVEHLDEDLKAAELDLDSAVKKHLDSFLADEGTRLAVSLKEEVISILREEITDIEQGASSLIYAMEGLAELDLVSEDDLVSHMGMVLKIMKSGKGDVSVLAAIRRDLLRHVDIT
jgi:aryl-alcohol dehydrogenase-like predicted oxidoreductase